MKFSIATALLLLCTHGASASFGYSEFNDFGPSNWANLPSEGNQCGGTNGASGFGQSPVTISAETVSSCDTGLGDYDFFPGDCAWDQLSFTIGNNGKIILLHY
jgi:carbonic anhydrase